MTPREDLVKSGLSDASMRAMSVRTVTVEELRELNLHNAEGGYYIPYWDLDGTQLLNFWRIKLLPPLLIRDGEKAREVKYVQPKGSVCHAYLPPTIEPQKWQDPKQTLYITEGEKKSVRAAQDSLTCLGVGGVDAWRTRSFKVQAECITEHAEYLAVKVEKGSQVEQLQEQICPELLAIPLEGRQVRVVFDSDARTNPDVQRALFELCLWLQGEGADAKCIYLPIRGEREESKIGLDDFLIEKGVESFLELPSTYPEHPRVKAWLRGQLDKPKVSRSVQIKCARGILNSLDLRGQRFVNPSNGEYYYRDSRTRVLHAFRWDSTEIRQVRLSSFGSLVQKEFGIGTSDTMLMSRIADLYTSGNVNRIVPRRVSWATDHALYYQLCDSYIAKVTSKRIEIVDNGTDDILFMSDQVDPVPDIYELLQLPPNSGESKWMEAIKRTQLQPMTGMSLGETQLLVVCMFYLNPMFRRWRGLMLPLELAISEPNSGKSFLYNLRRAILTGRPSLNNPPVSLRDWYAQLVAAPGIYVCDNVGELQREVRDQISDELARLVTDPNPKVEMRQLYTTANVGEWNVDATFAFTSIRNPFWKPDLLQRSIVLNLKAIPAGMRDSRWYQRQIEGSGRAEWLRDYLHTSMRFLASVEESWDDNYLSSHRLVHFEQALLHMGRALGQGDLIGGVVSKLFTYVQDVVTSNDPVLEALKVFVKEWTKTKIVKTSDITQWAEMDMDRRFSHIRILQNPVTLGRYMATHEYDITHSIGLVPLRRHNQVYYEVVKPEVEPESSKIELV